MIASAFRLALLALALAWGVFFAVPANAGVPTRPQIRHLAIVLEDGRSYALTPQQLEDPRGGAIFWGDWAVTNLLFPQFAARPLGAVDAAKVLGLWFLPGASGQLPAFLVYTPEGPVYPLDQPADTPQGFTFSRPRVARITVEYADGRRVSLSEYILRDPKSGVMVWSDFAVANLLIPFYRGARHLPTRPEDVMRTWHQARRIPGLATTVAAPNPTALAATAKGAAEPEAEELPGFLVKPACIPSYPSPDEMQP